MKLNLKRIKITKKIWIVLAAVLPVAAVLIIWVYNINSLPPSQASEHEYIQSTNSSSEIVRDIIYAPKKITDYVVIKVLNPESLTLYRLTSVLVAAAAVASFFVLVWQWISHRVAIMATLLFATSSLTLFSARSAEPEVLMLLAIPILLLAGTLLRIKEYDPYLPLTSLGVIMSLFVPGFWLLVMLGLVFSVRDIYDAFIEASLRLKLLWLTTVVPGLLLLLAGLLRGTNVVEWLGGSANLSIHSLLENIRDIPSQLFVNGFNDVSKWLPGTPIIDVVTASFFAIGMYYVARDNRFPIRRIILFGFLAASVSLIGLNGSAYIIMLLPLVYLFGAIGITFLLEQWFAIFPKNPVARSVGLSIIVLLVAMTSFYHIYRYHHVWPRSHVSSEVFKTEE